MPESNKPARQKTAKPVDTTIYRSFRKENDPSTQKGPFEFHELVEPLFEGTRGDYVDLIRTKAIELGYTQQTVNIDDVRDFCPPPVEFDPRVLGAAFKPFPDDDPRQWVRAKWDYSKRTMCHNRPISYWALYVNGVPAFQAKKTAA